MLRPFLSLTFLSGFAVIAHAWGLSASFTFILHLFFIKGQTICQLHKWGNWVLAGNLMLQMSVILLIKKTPLDWYWAYTVYAAYFLSNTLQEGVVDMITIISAQMLRRCSLGFFFALSLAWRLEQRLTGRAALKAWQPVSVTELFQSHISDAALPSWEDWL